MREKGRNEATPLQFALEAGSKLMQVSPGKCAHKAITLGHVTKGDPARLRFKRAKRKYNFR